MGPETPFEYGSGERPVDGNRARTFDRRIRRLPAFRIRATWRRRSVGTSATTPKHGRESRLPADAGSRCRPRKIDSNRKTLAGRPRRASRGAEAPGMSAGSGCRANPAAGCGSWTKPDGRKRFQRQHRPQPRRHSACRRHPARPSVVVWRRTVPDGRVRRRHVAARSAGRVAAPS